jgi:transcriptional regulator with XRE-family HTH domain
MSYGYSNRLIELNKKADGNSLGVQLGRLCIERDVPVSDVAVHLGVTRQTVYNWFCGANAPRAKLLQIKEIISSLAADK